VIACAIGGVIYVDAPPRQLVYPIVNEYRQSGWHSLLWVNKALTILAILLTKTKATTLILHCLISLTTQLLGVFF